LEAESPDIMMALARIPLDCIPSWQMAMVRPWVEESTSPNRKPESNLGVRLALMRIQWSCINHSNPFQGKLPLSPTS
jgi:hypothetical protein